MLTQQPLCAKVLMSNNSLKTHKESLLPFTDVESEVQRWVTYPGPRAGRLQSPVSNHCAVWPLPLGTHHTVGRSLQVRPKHCWPPEGPVPNAGISGPSWQRSLPGPLQHQPSPGHSCATYG